MTTPMTANPMPRKIWFSMPTLEAAEEVAKRCEANGYAMKRPIKDEFGGYEITGELSHETIVAFISKHKKRV